MLSKKEIKQRIKDINEQILELSKMPTTASVKGLSSSFAGRIEQLQKEREYWSAQLQDYDLQQAGLSAAQGPKLTVY